MAVLIQEIYKILHFHSPKACFKLNRVGKITSILFQWMQLGQKLLGIKAFSLVTRPFFYAQFVGGDSEDELSKTAQTLWNSNVRLMVCPVQEEDLEDEADKYKIVFIFIL